MTNPTLSADEEDFEKNNRYSGAAKRIIDKLKPISSHTNYAKRRWFWELTQNACDACKDDNDDVTDVEVTLSESKLIFRHNGDPFNYIEARNLIEPDSDKDDKTKEAAKKQIGQYGTGFISTHILSTNIGVSGILNRKAGGQCQFSFNLNRSFTDEKDLKFSLMSSISISLKELNENCNDRPVSYHAGLDTSFTYDFAYPYPGEIGLDMAMEGISALENDLPYVMTFFPKLKSVTIFININTDEVKTICYIREKIKEQPYRLFKISQHTAFTDSVEDSTVNTYVAEFKNEKISIAVKVLVDEEGKITLAEQQESFCKLFCAFPMIGSEEFLFPVAVNSRFFIPRNERDGIEISGNDITNRELLIQTVNLYKTLLETADSEKWKNIIEICGCHTLKTGDEQTKKWFNENIAGKLRDALLHHKTVELAEGRVSLSEAKIPYADSPEKAKEIADLYKDIIVAKIPRGNHSAKWYNILDFTYHRSQQYTLDMLIKEAASSTLKDLKLKLEANTDVQKWLHKLLSLALKEERTGILDQQHVIPTKNGTMKRRIHVFYDDDVPDAVKEIYDEFTGNVYDDLLLPTYYENIIGLLDPEKKLTIETIGRDLDKKILDARKNGMSNQLSIAVDGILKWVRELRRDGYYYPELDNIFQYILSNKAQLVLDSFTEEQREQAFVIVQSGKTKALAKMATSKLSAAEIEMVAGNINAFKKFLELSQNQVDDETFANATTGETGEQAVYSKLCELFDDEMINWASKNGERRFDFEIKDTTRNIHIYIDAKATVAGVGNSDSVPFFVRKSQWDFLDNPESHGRYYIARVFKEADDFDIRFVKFNKTALIQPV